jgi:hypothetical protein
MNIVVGAMFSYYQFLIISQMSHLPIGKRKVKSKAIPVTGLGGL